MKRKPDTPLFFVIMAVVMGAVMLFCAGKLLHDRIKYGPPCEQVAADKYVCFHNWKED